MSKYLLDTNILVYSSQNLPPLDKLMDQWIETESIALSVIAISEYLVKINDSESDKFTLLLNICPIYPVDLEIAKLAAEYRKQSLKTQRGHLLGCYLAATAKLHDLTLVTRNTDDFPMTDIQILNPFTFKESL